jgi:gas vesicle protein
MRKASRSMMAWGAVGAMAGMALIPAFSSKTRKRVSRSARNAYFKVSDMMQDMKDMGNK